MSAVRRALASFAVAGVAATGLVVSAQEGAGAAPGPSTVRVNTRWEKVVDSEGRVWSGRAGFTGPAKPSSGGVGRDILGTTEDVLYRTNVFGATGYSAAVTDGTYRVRLLMAEDYHARAGGRVFDVLAEGRPALEGVDIAGSVGRHHAYDRTFDTTVDDGRLDLTFVAKADVALVSAIEIVPAPAPGDVAPSGRTGSEQTTHAEAAPTAAPATTPSVSTGETTSTSTTTSMSSADSTSEALVPSGSSLPPKSPVNRLASSLALSADVKGGGFAPLVSQGSVLSSAGAGDSRSEVFWGTSEQGRIALKRGDTVTAEFQVRHFLRDPLTGAAPSPNTWHTFFQLHGPTHRNTWPGPPLAFAWQNGTYRIGGGASVPSTNGTPVLNKGSWFQPYLAAPDGVWRSFKVQTYLGGPGKGWVSVWVDGKPYIQRWKPTAGTMYTESGPYSHKEINIKSGLYTGTNSPTWRRSVEHRGMRVEWTSPGGGVTAALR